MIELPGYQLIRELGRGGMARVYLALHEGLDRHVAIKLMYPNLSADPAFSDRFLREARIVARMSHPNIITIFDVNVHKGYHYIAMEYLPGESLGDKIKAGIEPSKALAYLKQMSMGLKFAHDKGFVHRDIKPENILFREDGSPVITDFGVARAEVSDTRMTEVGTIIGTPHYMSPEQAQGIEIKSNSDIYSLGVVFYEMLTGVVPYHADSIVAIMYKHVNDPIPELTGKLKIFQTLLDRLLAKDANDRYQTADDIIKDIERIELRVAPEFATIVMPPKDTSESFGSVRTWFSPQKKRALKDLFEKKYALAIAAFVFVSTASAILFINLPENEPPPSEITKTKYIKQLEYKKRVEQAHLKQVEEERVRQEALAREAIEQERAAREQLAAEKERLSLAREASMREKADRERIAAEKEKLALAMREKTKRSRKIGQKVNQHMASAEAALQRNRLKDAYGFYQQALKIDTKNKAAKKGINRVAEKYLALAISKAKKSNFDTADAYLRSVAKISPKHPKLATTQRKIFKLKNKQLATKTKQQSQSKQSQVTPQIEVQIEPEKVTPKQRSFGGF